MVLHYVYIIRILKRFLYFRIRNFISTFPAIIETDTFIKSKECCSATLSQLEFNFRQF